MSIPPNVNNDASLAPQTQRQRLTKIKPTASSFRLGQDSATSAQIVAGKQREFRFQVPSASELGNVDESTKILAIIRSLSDSGAGRIAKLSISESTWDIHLRLPSTDEVINEEQYLSETSRQLAPVVDQLPDLKSGFQRGKGSTWKYCINDFVAAEGSL